jgi:hypothetical protein
MRRALLAGLAGLGLAACVSKSAPASNVYSGELDWHFETSSFVTNDGRGPWWLSADGAVWSDVVAPIQRGGGGPWGQVRLTVEAELSAPGRYGHMGAYEREIRVTRVISSELISSAHPPSGS